MWSIHRPAPGLLIGGQHSWEDTPTPCHAPDTLVAAPEDRAPHAHPFWPPRSFLPPGPALPRRSLVALGCRGRHTDRNTSTLQAPPQAGDTWLAPGLEAPRRGCNPTCPAPLHGVQAVSTPFPWGAPGPQEHLVRPRVHLKGAHSLGEGSVEGPGQPCPLQCGATGGLGGEAGLCQTAPRAAGVPGRAWAWLGVTLWQLGVGPRDHGLLLIQAPSSCVRVDLCGGCWGQAQGPWPWPAAPGSFLS